MDDTVEAVAEEPAPVTLPELERAIVESAAMQGRFEPHPEIAGAHLLDWHGAYQAVTFNPELFDQHPNTLRLLTYGGGLLGGGPPGRGPAGGRRGERGGCPVCPGHARGRWWASTGPWTAARSVPWRELRAVLDKGAGSRVEGRPAADAWLPSSTPPPASSWPARPTPPTPAARPTSRR